MDAQYAQDQYFRAQKALDEFMELVLDSMMQGRPPSPEDREELDYLSGVAKNCKKHLST